MKRAECGVGRLSRRWETTSTSTLLPSPSPPRPLLRGLCHVGFSCPRSGRSQEEEVSLMQCRCDSRRELTSSVVLVPAPSLVPGLLRLLSPGTERCLPPSSDDDPSPLDLLLLLLRSFSRGCRMWILPVVGSVNVSSPFVWPRTSSPPPRLRLGRPRPRSPRVVVVPRRTGLTLLPSLPS